MLKLLSRLSPFVLVAACAVTPPQPAVPTEPVMPVMRWDFRSEGDDWTAATLAALYSSGMPLLAEVPRDIMEWCPGYISGEMGDRAAFWAGVLSALAKHESTWNPAASGGGGRWIGLTQIAPATARSYGCAATSTAALKDGAANLRCAVRIAARTVPRDGYVASGREGLAADWAPFLNASKRADMVNWTRQQSYCQA